MDLVAYEQIEQLEGIARNNGIKVPRLRGYRLMELEKPYNQNYENIEVDCAIALCEAHPFWNPNADCSELSEWTDYLKNYYLVKATDDEGDTRYVAIRWNRIHGWKRRTLKTFIHNEKKKADKQRNVWNKYAGRKDVLYIHARIGGGNWAYYHDQVDRQPWFLEKVDDFFDSTYCDIYAKIGG